VSAGNDRISTTMRHCTNSQTRAVLHRILDMMRICQNRDAHFKMMEAFVHALMRQQSENVKQCYQMRYKMMVTELKSRRPQIFLWVLEYLGARSTWGSQNRQSRASLIEQIECLDENSTLYDNIKLMLTPPGAEGTWDWDEETKTIQPIHELEYFRPSSHCSSNSVDLVPTQEGQSEESSAAERLRLVALGDTFIRSVWFFLDCFVQSAYLARVIAADISHRIQRNVAGEVSWCPKTLDDFVKMFWDTSYFMNSHVRTLSVGLGGRAAREEAKSIMKGVIHAMIPHHILAFVAEHGMTNRLTDCYLAARSKFPAKSSYSRVDVFSFASLAMYQRSKVPAFLGGKKFYDSKVLPIVNTYMVRLIDATKAAKAGASLSENERGDLADIGRSIIRGDLELPNIVADLYQAVMKEMPLYVDRARGQKTETANEAGASQVNTTTAAADEEGVEEEQGTRENVSTKANAAINEALKQAVHPYLNTMIDGRYRYSPREVLLKIAAKTGYEEIEELRQTMEEHGMRSEPESDSDDERQPPRQKCHATMSSMEADTSSEEESTRQRRYSSRVQSPLAVANGQSSSETSESESDEDVPLNMLAGKRKAAALLDREDETEEE